MPHKFKAIFFAPEGDFQIEYPADTIDGVLNQIENWPYWAIYPFAFVTDGKKIVAAYDGHETIVGKTIDSATKQFQAN